MRGRWTPRRIACGIEGRAAVRTVTQRASTRRSVSRCIVRAVLPAAALAACGASTNTAPSTEPSAEAVPAFVDPASEREVAVSLAAPRSAKASPFDDPGALTRLGLYATPDQAARTLAARPGRALRVKVEPAEPDAVELAVRVVWGEQAAADVPSSAPVFVSGPDLRLAATVVDRLQDSGFSRVFLVGPPR
jgi:hypothetical protein